MNNCANQRSIGAVTITRFILMIMIVLLLMWIPVLDDGVEAATKLKVKKITLTVGKSYTLKSTGKVKKKTWKSSNSKVATLSGKKSKSVKIKAIKKGTAKITVKKGKKTLTCKVTVTNAPKVKSLAGGRIFVEAKWYTYTGKAITPKLDVYDSSYNQLKPGIDYTTSYSNNIKPGTANVMVKGIGKFKGSLSTTFTIEPAYNEITATLPSTRIVVGQNNQITYSGKGNISFESHNTNVATVNSSGVVVGVAPGFTRIAVKRENDPLYSYNAAYIDITVAGGDKQEYTYELYLMNKHKLYASSPASNALIYIKTDNPDPSRITLISDNGSEISANSFDDIDYTGNNDGTIYSVDGGYIVFLQPSKTGMNNVTLWESYNGIDSFKIAYEIAYDRIRYARLYGEETSATLALQVNDWDEGYIDEMNRIISKATTPSMTFHEKMEAIQACILSEYNYRLNSSGYVTNPGYLRTVDTYGTAWDIKEIDSDSSPKLLMNIATLLGCTEMERLTGTNHAYVNLTYDGVTKTYMACHPTNQNAIDPTKIVYHDFSKY